MESFYDIWEIVTGICLLSVLTGVQMKRVDFRENI